MVDRRDFDPAAIEAAKRAVLVDEFVKFRERAVQHTPMLTMSTEYKNLGTVLHNDDALEDAAIARLIEDPKLYLAGDTAVKTKEALWHLVRGLFVESKSSGLRQAMLDALEALDPRTARDYRKSDAQAYKSLKAAFSTPSDD